MRMLNRAEPPYMLFRSLLKGKRQGEAASVCYARKAQSNLAMATSFKLLGEKVHLWWPILARIPRCPTEKGGVSGRLKSGKSCDLVFLIEGLLRPGSFPSFDGI